MDNNQEKECVICKAHFNTKQYNKIYCSHKCYKYAYRLRDKEKISALQIHKYNTDNAYRLKLIEKTKQYELTNKDKGKQYRKKYRQTEIGKLVKRREYQKNKTHYQQYFKQYSIINKAKIKETQRRIAQREESKIKHRLCNKTYKLKVKELENQRRRELGLPLVGEGSLNEIRLKKMLDKSMFDMGQYYDNQFWKLEEGRLVKTTSRYGLQLDRYYQDANIAFEYDGKQHSTFVPLMHKNIKNLYAQRKRDKRKNRMCEKANVALIRINYLDALNLDTLHDKVSEHPLIEVIESIPYSSIKGVESE